MMFGAPLAAVAGAAGVPANFAGPVAAAVPDAGLPLAAAGLRVVAAGG
jgi:hypothetical protein